MFSGLIAAIGGLATAAIGLFLFLIFVYLTFMLAPWWLGIALIIAFLYGLVEGLRGRL